MKFSLLLMLLFLFSTNCGRFKRDKESDDDIPKETEIPKIQKNSAFVPVCGDTVIAWCDGDNPACGTVRGSGNLKAYCIDEDDTVLGEASCFNKDLGQPRCVPI